MLDQACCFTSSADHNASFGTNSHELLHAKHLCQSLFDMPVMLYPIGQATLQEWYCLRGSLEPTLLAAGAQTNGSWRVVGNSGSVPVHALPFTNIVLFMQRGNNANGTSYDPDLVVCHYMLWSHSFRSNPATNLCSARKPSMDWPAYCHGSIHERQHFSKHTARLCRWTTRLKLRWLQSTT